MSKPAPDSSSYSGGPHGQPSSATSSSQQHSARGTSSGPVSSYSGYSAGDQSHATTATYSQSQGGYPSSGTVGTPGGRGPSVPSSAGPFYAQGPLSTLGPQPGSGGTYAPPSSMVGAGGYMSNSSGVGMPGMQPAMYTSSNASGYSGGYSGSQPVNGMYAPSMMQPQAASYPMMGPVGSQPLPPHGPSSSLGPVMGPHGMVIPGMDSAAADAEAKRLAGAAAQDVGAYGDRAHLIHFRPKLGEKLVCSCPMVCLVNTGRGMGPSYVPQVRRRHASDVRLCALVTAICLKCRMLRSFWCSSLVNGHKYMTCENLQQLLS